MGYEIDLGLEIHRNLRPEEAVTLAHELLPFRILYYEDPLAPESTEAVDYVARHIHLPVATGERFYSIQQFKDLIDRKIGQPDPAGHLLGRRIHPGEENRRTR